jgi:hypothetical protein
MTTAYAVFAPMGLVTVAAIVGMWARCRSGRIARAAECCADAAVYGLAAIVVLAVLGGR